MKNALHNKSLRVDNVGSLDVLKASWYFNPGNITDIALFCMFSSVSVSVSAGYIYMFYLQ